MAHPECVEIAKERPGSSASGALEQRRPDSTLDKLTDLWVSRGRALPFMEPCGPQMPSGNRNFVGEQIGPGKGDQRQEAPLPAASAMRAARPATGPAHPLLQLRANPLDMLPPGFRLLHGDHPADPFIARERGNILPVCPRDWVGYKGSS